MKNLFSIFLTLLCLNAQAQNFQWARDFKRAIGYINGSGSGNSVVSDVAGNVYTTGSFYGTVDFDPTIGVFPLTAIGNNDIFITKLDASGNFVWAKAIGGSNNEFGKNIDVDSHGNLYITGDFKGIVDFDPSAKIVNYSNKNPDGLYNSFVLKLDTYGNFLWVKKIGDGRAENGALMIDKADNVYITGNFSGTIDIANNSLSAVSGSGIYIAKLDSSGKSLLTKNITSNATITSSSITADINGNIYLTGTYYTTTDFNPGSGVFNLTGSGGNTVFVLMLNSFGNFVWAKKIGDGNARSNTINVDASANIYVTGNFSGRIYFDESSLNSSLLSAGGYDIFISKINSYGIYEWCKKIGGNNDDLVSSACLSNSGINITGSFKGTVDFDPNSTTQSLVSAGSDNDIFISSLDPIGNLKWAKRIGGSVGSSQQNSNAMTSDLEGNLYTIGNFQGTVDFDPNDGIYNLTAVSGFVNIFNLKLGITSLPLTLLNFVSYLNKGVANLKWQTTNEVNSSHFNIQRSTNGSSFTTVGSISAKGGGSYGYADDVSNLNNAVIYYRLEIVDKDGSLAYSKIVAVTLTTQNLQFALYPNPVTNQLQVNFATGIKANTVINIINSLGMMVKQINTGNTDAGTLKINTTELTAGVYIVQLISGGTIINTQKVIKQ